MARTKNQYTKRQKTRRTPWRNSHLEHKNVFKKTNGVGLKKNENITQGQVLVYKSYTDYGNLKMNIVK